MLHLSSFLISSIVFLCSTFAPVGFDVNEVLPSEEIYYFDTLYDNADAPMPIDYTSVDIPYLTKTRNVHTLAIRYPAYDYAPAVGCCASIAAGNLIGFYDRYDENLIPNHVSGIPLFNSFSYNIEDSAVQAVIDKLYEYITGDGYGATEDEFINGVTRYCKEKSKTITFTSCMQNGSFSYSKAKNYLDQNLPIVLFLSGYNVGTMFTYENMDNIDYYYSNANHVMIGFGYDEYSYTTTDGNLKYEYFSVAAGADYKSSGLYNINFKTKINDALAVNIY